MRHGRRDANHADIRKVLRAAGCTVQDLGDVGKGCPDLLVGKGGRNFLLEVKDGKKHLTDDELEFFRDWRGQVTVVRSAEEAIEAVFGKSENNHG